MHSAQLRVLPELTPAQRSQATLGPWVKALGYRDYRDRYGAMAESLGFEGHIAWAKAMVEGGQ
jgi:hypothetical protein